MNANQARQGDLFFEKVNYTPVRKADHKLNNSKFTLALGEVTGHHHTVATSKKEDFENIDVFLDEKGALIVQVKSDEPAKVTHQEHGTIELTKGFWKVDFQQEYLPQGWNRVAD